LVLAIAHLSNEAILVASASTNRPARNPERTVHVAEELGIGASDVV